MLLYTAALKPSTTIGTLSLRVDAVSTPAARHGAYEFDFSIAGQPFTAKLPLSLSTNAPIGGTISASKE